MTAPDAARVAEIADGLSQALRGNLFGLSPTAWLTKSEMPKATGMGLTLLCNRIFANQALAERRWTTWGADRLHNQLRGEGYEYRATPLGIAVRDLLREREGVK